MTRHEIRTFEAASAALRSPSLRQALYGQAGTLLGSAVINLHGPEHHARRSEEAKIFRKDFFQYYENEVLAPEMEATLIPYIRSGKADLFDLGYRLMVNSTADFAGIDRPDRTPEGTEDLVRLLKTFTQAASLDQPRLIDIEELKKKIRGAIAEFHERYLTPSAERRLAIIEDIGAGCLPETELPRDILSILLQEQEQLGLGRDDILQESIFFLMAGAHTSVHSLTHVVNEMFAWLDAHPEGWARLRDDPFFIQRCVHESVRLHPSSPLAKRRSESPVTLAPIGDLAEGDEVVIFLGEANQDPDVFGADAARFCPDRPIPAGKSPYGLSMGLGPHTCLGLNLAMGNVPRAGADPATHHFGTVSMIVTALFAAGVRRDPAEVALKDPTTTRAIWTYFPVVFEAPPAA